MDQRFSTVHDASPKQHYSGLRPLGHGDATVDTTAPSLMWINPDSITQNNA